MAINFQAIVKTEYTVKCAHCGRVLVEDEILHSFGRICRYCGNNLREVGPRKEKTYVG